MKLSKGKIKKTFNKKNISNKRIKGGKRKFKKNSNKNKKHKHISNKSMKVKRGGFNLRSPVRSPVVWTDPNMEFLNSLKEIVEGKPKSSSQEAKEYVKNKLGQTGMRAVGSLGKKNKLKGEQQAILREADVDTIEQLDKKLAEKEAKAEAAKEELAKAEEALKKAKEAAAAAESDKAAAAAVVEAEAKVAAAEAKVEETKLNNDKDYQNLVDIKLKYMKKTKEVIEISKKEKRAIPSSSPSTCSSDSNIKVVKVTNENSKIIRESGDFLTLEDKDTGLKFIVDKPTIFPKIDDELLFKLPTELEVSENQTITRLKKEIKGLLGQIDNSNKTGFSLCALLNGDFSSLAKLNPMKKGCDEDKAGGAVGATATPASPAVKV